MTSRPNRLRRLSGSKIQTPIIFLRTTTMNGRQQYVELLTAASPYIRSEFGVKSMRIFGSVARDEESDDSDVDIFVDMPPKALKLVELKQYLQEILGRAVDIVRSHPRLDSFLTDEINRDGITIFAE